MLRFCRLVQSRVPGATKWPACNPMKLKSGGGPPSIFFGYIAITRPRIDEFSPNLVGLCGEWGSGQCAMVNIYPTRGQILRGATPNSFCVILGNSAADERIFTIFGAYRVGQKVISLVHYITLYDRYHFFGPPCIWTMGHRKLRCGQRAPL